MFFTYSIFVYYRSILYSMLLRLFKVESAVIEIIMFFGFPFSFGFFLFSFGFLEIRIAIVLLYFCINSNIYKNYQKLIQILNVVSCVPYAIVHGSLLHWTWGERVPLSLAERTFFAVPHFHFMTAFQTQPKKGDGFFRFQTITRAQFRFLQRFSSLSFLLSVDGLAKFSYSCNAFPHFFFYFDYMASHYLVSYNAFPHFFFYFDYMALHSLVSLLPDRSRKPPFFVSESDKRYLKTIKIFTIILAYNTFRSELKLAATTSRWQNVETWSKSRDKTWKTSRDRTAVTYATANDYWVRHTIEIDWKNLPLNRSKLYPIDYF